MIICTIICSGHFDEIVDAELPTYHMALIASHVKGDKTQAALYVLAHPRHDMRSAAANAFGKTTVQ